MAKRVRLKQGASTVSGETTKDTLIADLVSARRDILGAVAALSTQQQDKVFLGEWSVKELLAHLIGWDYTYIAAVEELLMGELPSFYSAYDADWTGYNFHLVNQYNRGNWVELLGAVEQSHQALVGSLRTVPPGEFGKDRGVSFEGTPVTIARLLKAEVKDEREHYEQVKQWAG